MVSLRWKVFVWALLLGLSVSCSAPTERQDPASSDSESETFTIFSNGQGQALLPSPDAEEEKPTPAPHKPRRGADQRYPPPIAPPPPHAPRPPPVRPRYSLEPEPSKVKAFPNFKVEKLGIWECDHYFSEYLKCINRYVPRDQDAAFAHALEKQVKVWKKLAETEAGREQVAKECAAAFTRSKKAMQPYKCVWK